MAATPFCNVRVVDASTPAGLFAAARALGSDREPLLIRGFPWLPLTEAAQNGHANLERFLADYGQIEMPFHTHSRSTATARDSTAWRSLQMRQFALGVRNGSVPRGAYSFVSVLPDNPEEAFQAQLLAHLSGALGTRLRALSSQLRGAVANTTAAMPADAAGLLARAHGANDVSTYLSIGSGGTGLSFHRHQLAANLLLTGRKRWFLAHERDAGGAPIDPLLGVRFDSLMDVHGYGPMDLGSMVGWVEGWYERHAAHKRSWRGHAWECTQSAGELLVLPDAIAHGVVNLDWPEGRPATELTGVQDTQTGDMPTVTVALTALY